jgi:hypothetical protein
MVEFERSDLVVLRAASSKPMRVATITTGYGRIRRIECMSLPGGPKKSYAAGDLDFYPHDLPVLWTIRSIVSILGILLGIASCVTAGIWPKETWLFAANSIVWTLGPPVWFIIEYCLLVPKWGNRRNKPDLQYGQGLASKFWLGVGSLLVVIYKRLG